LHNTFIHEIWIGPEIKIKRSNDIFVEFMIPLESCQSDLKGIHSLTVVL
jgi:hypothetical protein